MYDLQIYYKGLHYIIDIFLSICVRLCRVHWAQTNDTVCPLSECYVFCNR